MNKPYTFCEMRTLLIRSVLTLVAVLICVFLISCATQNFDERLAYSYGAVTAIRVSAANALSIQSITVNDAEKVLDDTDKARELLNQAKTIAATGDTSTALGKLSTVTFLLTQLQQFLLSKGVE